MAGLKSALIVDGPNKGLTFEQCERYGLVLTGNDEDDRRRAEIARKRISADVAKEKTD